MGLHNFHQNVSKIHAFAIAITEAALHVAEPFKIRFAQRNTAIFVGRTQIFQSNSCRL
jgi:hypothetical protein